MEPYSVGYVHVQLPLPIQHTTHNIDHLPVPFRCVELNLNFVYDFGAKYSIYSNSCINLFLKHYINELCHPHDHLRCFLRQICLSSTTVFIVYVTLCALRQISCFFYYKLFYLAPASV